MVARNINRKVARCGRQMEGMFGGGRTKEKLSLNGHASCYSPPPLHYSIQHYYYVLLLTNTTNIG